jgi:sporulation protein YlmC with PRC-barrel domain
MKKFLISAVSLAALTAGGIAFAEDTTTTIKQPDTTTQTQQQPAESGTMTTEQKAAQPVSDTTTVLPKSNAQDTTANPPATTETKTVTTAPATGSSSFTITGLEPGNVVMASSLIGSTVYSSANENIGDINDVVLAKDGKVLAVIIGVGGFLGLGEKDVAVPMDRLQFVKDESNNVKFTISASKEELEQAAAFDKTKLVIGGTSTTTSP